LGVVLAGGLASLLIIEAPVVASGDPVVEVIELGEAVAIEVVSEAGATVQNERLAVQADGHLLVRVGQDTIGLDKQTTVFVAGSHDHRQLTLERGAVSVEAAERALGQVLEVVAGAVTVRVVGTRFRVATVEDGVRVDLAEGVVKVDLPDGNVRLLAAGQSLVIGESLVPGQADEVAVAALLHQGVNPEDLPVQPAPATPEAFDLARIKHMVVAGELVASETLLVKRLEAAPEDEGAWDVLAGVYARTDRPQLAVECWLTAAQLANPAAEGRLRFRAAHLLLGPLQRSGLAAEQYQLVVDGEAHSLRPDALFGLAQAQAAGGDVVAAEATRAVLALEHPTSAAALGLGVDP
jgi:hypothetical protein